MDADWDLQAVVRGCCSAVSSSSSSSSTTTTATPNWPTDAYNKKKPIFYGENLMWFSPDLFQSRNENSIEQFLNNRYDPFNFSNLQKPPPSPQNFPISPLSVLGGLPDPPYHHRHHQQETQFQGKHQSLSITRCTNSHAQGTTKFKKRKNQIKKVCQVPAEGSSSDMWSWRKYGQKPIKGSPYPRGYYKCSTSKGCMARKQVERNRSDPGMLIITYTGEHSHPAPIQRNSLSGSSRNKPTTSSDDDNRSNKPSPSSPVSPTTEKMEEIERDDTDDDINFDGDIFDGLGELIGPATGDSFSTSTTGAPFGGYQITWPQQPPPLPAGVDF